MLGHGTEKADATSNVYTVVLEGDFTGFTNSLGWSATAQLDHDGADKTHLEGGKVNNAVDFGVLGENLIDGSLVGDVELVELGSAATDELNAVHSNLGGVVEAVYDHDIVVILEKGKGGERADVASTTDRVRR